MKILVFVGILFSACTINREPIKQKNKDQFLIGNRVGNKRYIPYIPED